MALPTIDKTSRYEKKQHGSTDFPFIVYHTQIPRFICNYPLHWHDEMEIIIVQKGSCIVTINTTAHTMTEGDIAFIMPGMLHAIDQNPSQEAVYFNIVFDLHLLGCGDGSDSCFEKNLRPYLDGSVFLPPVLPAGHPLSSDLSSHLMALAAHRRQHDNSIELFIKAQLFTIFWLLEPLRIEAVQNLSNNPHRTQIQKMKELLRFLDNNYTRVISLGEAADFCGYSTSYFMKFFKAFTGTTFVEYLNHCRLKKAAELLTETDETVLAISEATGFENHSYFIRLFKRYYGTTPYQYRKQNR